MTRNQYEWVTALAVVSFAGGIWLARVPTFPLLGFDSYPEILSSRILDLDDFIGTFTEQTSEGFYPFAFYRPIFNLSLAADYALWGIEARGYHLTTIALLCACGLSLFWLSRCLLGPDARWGPWATLSAFLLAPVHVEIIPLVSRRMDVLCGLFSALALATQIDHIRRPRPGAGLVPAMLTMLAVGSKEAGVAIVPLMFLLAILLRPEIRRFDRLRIAGWVTLPHLAAVAFVFSARFAAIGGLGGHPTTDPSAILTRLPEWLGSVVVQIVSAWPIRRDGIASGWLQAISAITLIALIGLSLYLLLPGKTRVEARRKSLSESTSIAIGGTWIVMLAGIYAVTGLLQPWYLFLPTMGLALVIGATVERLARTLRVRSGASRYVALAGLIGIAFWAVLVARYSPLLVGFGHWERGAERVGRYLRVLTLRIERSPDGRYFEIPPPPKRGRGHPSPIATPFATWVHVYSLPAWAELRFPGRSIEFRQLSVGEVAPGPEPGVLLIGIRGGKPRGR